MFDGEKNLDHKTYMYITIEIALTYTRNITNYIFRRLECFVSWFSIVMIFFSIIIALKDAFVKFNDKYNQEYAAVRLSWRKVNLYVNIWSLSCQ